MLCRRNSAVRGSLPGTSSPGLAEGVRVLKMLTGFATGPQGLVLLVIASGIGNASSNPSANSDLAINSNVVNASTVIFWAFGAAVVAEIQPRPCLAARCKPPSVALQNAKIKYNTDYRPAWGAVVSAGAMIVIKRLVGEVISEVTIQLIGNWAGSIASRYEVLRMDCAGSVLIVVYNRFCLQVYRL